MVLIEKSKICFIDYGLLLYNGKDIIFITTVIIA